MVATADTYERTRQRHLRRFADVVGPSVARLEMPVGALAAERTRRLRQLVAVAKESSPWHAERLRDLDAATVTEADLLHLPPMSKDDLLASFDQIVTDRRIRLGAVEAHIESLRDDAYLFGEFHAVASGGSSGTRGVFVWGWDAWAEGFASIVRPLLRARARDPRGVGAPGPLAMLAAAHASHMTGSMPMTFRNPMLPVVPFPVTAPVSHTVEGLNAAQPRVIAGYASAIADLVEEARRGRLRVRPSGVITTSEPLPAGLREAIAEQWGASVSNSWASSEFAGMGAGCFESEGMHLSDDLLVYEFVDADGSHVDGGTRASHVYVTNLYNHAMPLIRYEMTDEVQLLDEPCVCGSAHRRVDDIEGRLDEGFVYPDGTRIHPHVFRSALGRRADVGDYRVIQTPAGARIEVRRGSGTDLAELERDLAAQLRAAGLSDPEVIVARVEEMPRQSSGKLKRFVPLKRPGS